MATSKRRNTARDERGSRPSASAREARDEQSRALEALYKISSIVAGPQPFTETLLGVLEEVKTVMEVDSADLRMPDAEKAGLRVVASVGSALHPIGTFRAYADSRTGRAFQQGKPIISHDFEVNHRGGADRSQRSRSGYDAQSVAWLPVKASGRTVGVLAVDTAKRDHFNAHRVRILTTIADGIGTLIENAQLRETERRHVRELEVLHQAATILAGDGTFEEKAKRVLDAIVALSGDCASLRVPDESGEQLRLLAATWRGTIDVIEVRGSTTGEAFSSGKPVVVNDYAADPRASQRAVDHGFRSMAAFPIVVDGVPRAALVVSSRLRSYFTPERVALLATIAAGIGPSIERARASEQLQVAEQQLVQSGKLAAIGELAAGIAHEINNPLNNVMGFAQLLMDQDLPPQAQRDLEKIYAEGQRAATIVQQVLVFARTKEPETRPVDIRAMIDHACSLKAYDLRRRSIELRTHVADSLPPVAGDDQRLIEVMLNLLTNAEQAIASTERAGVITISCEADGDRIRIRVSDDGPGIPPEVLGRIFEPFFTTKGVGAGTGLGLSICQGIIRQHQGELWAESDLGTGATFHVELPVLVTPPPRAASPVEEQPPVPPMRILVVDDEPNARDLMARVLMSDGHAVDTASDGADAGSRLREASYDCVVTDMRMAGMGGEELYRLTEQTIPELAGRFIFVTGDTMSPETSAFLSSTASPHLMKPIDGGELRRRVAELQPVRAAER
ncbi:MAG: GAF domain-containing protein [Chloroflexi bacterium]|nr:GAF domain-containing protein [Chloroflexota bacterium]